MFGHVDLKCRPLRCALLVDPGDKKTVQRAIELNSSLWGGKYNPIIQLYGRTPKAWHKKRVTFSKAREVVLGNIEAFDPDILIQCSKKLPAYLKGHHTEIIHADEVWKYLGSDGSNLSPLYGIGVFEVLNEVYEKHFKYVERFPHSVDFPESAGRNRLYWSSLFGRLPDRICDSVVAYYTFAVELRQTLVSANNAARLIEERVLYPVRLSDYRIKRLSRSWSRGDAAVLYMDMDSVADIVDFWNLRATGKTVIPLPRQMVNVVEWRELIERLVVATYRPLRYNKEMYYSTSFICSHNTDFKELQDVARTFGRELKLKKEEKEPAIVVQGWYPRIWQDWSRYHDQVEPDDIWHTEESLDFNDVDQKAMFACIRPDFADRSKVYGKPQCANETTFRFYDSKDFVAQVLPKDGGESLSRTISNIMSFGENCRIGRNGLVKLASHFFSQHWNVPMAHDVFLAWLKDKGWDAKLSTGGLLAKQLYVQLEGDLQSIANTDVLKLLEAMAGGADNDKERPVGEVKNRLKAASDLYDRHQQLVSKGIFRIGSKIKCPHCQRHAWYSVEALAGRLECPKCLNDFDAVGKVEEGTWCYRTSGPISAPKHADGGITVLFALKQLQQNVIGLDTTPAVSFEATSPLGDELEVDFGCLWRQESHGMSLDGVVFGECKSYNSFERRDISQMRKLAKAFPGAVLAFCTLKDALDPKEIRLIAPLAKSGHKYWRHERPLNPVLILTARELLCRWSWPQLWKETPGTKQFGDRHELLELCDATQQIYLGLPSWHQTWHEHREKRRKRKQLKIESK